MSDPEGQTIEVVHVQLSDMAELMKLAVEFFYESDNKDMTLDTGKYRHYLENFGGIPFTRILMARVCGMPAAYTVISAFAEFTKEPIGEMYHFYVKPEFRGSMVARTLVDAVVKQFDQWGTYKDFVEAASGVDGDRSAKMFGNLFKKFGFKQSGVIMVRERKNG